MPYTNCSACGAKALVGATRCPRCQAPFVSYDPKGERVPTVNCPNCGVQRPVAIGVCPNCMTSTVQASARMTRGIVIAVTAIIAIMSVGWVISRRVDRSKVAARSAATVADTGTRGDSAPARDTAPVVVADSTKLRTASPIATPTQALPVTPPLPRATTAAAPPANRALEPLKPAPLPTVAVSDTGQWESAVANTWVRVRAAPSRESGVLRMIDSAQRVHLGPPLAGWRPVRVGVDRGWVDPRLFTVVPPRP